MEGSSYTISSSTESSPTKISLNIPAHLISPIKVARSLTQPLVIGDLKVVCMLGKGSQAQVVLCTSDTFGPEKFFAVKIYNHCTYGSNPALNEQHMINLQNEIKLLVSHFIYSLQQSLLECSK